MTQKGHAQCFISVAVYGYYVTQVTLDCSRKHPSQQGVAMSFARSSRSNFTVLFVLFALLGGCGGGSSSENAVVQPQGGDNTDPAGSGDDNNGQDGNNGVVESALAMAAPLSPVIRTGFGDGVTGTPASDITQFGGADAASDIPNDWTRLQAGSDDRVGGYFEIQYQGGDTTQRYARLSPDPDDADNQTLQFWLQEANTRIEDPTSDWFELRGRVQANFYENYNLDSYYQTVRMRLGPDFAALTQHGGTFDWLTLFEAWNGAIWTGDEHPFHIRVDLAKPVGAAGSRLHLKARGSTFAQGTGFTDVWSDTNTDFAVPLETWMTLELYMKEGDDQDGRFYMTVTPDGGEKAVLFDIVDYTHNPADPAPTGFDYINPIKLYMLEPVLGIVTETGGAMDIHWDDLEFGHTAN